MKYDLVLPNEVRVSKANIEGIFNNKRVFVAGYGSLLYPEGWWHRRMEAFVKSGDLIECKVDGFKRGPYGIYGGVHYYGAVHDADHHINATLVEIHSVRDWAELMATELIAGLFKKYNYRVCDVTAHVSGAELPKNAVVHMVCNEARNVKMSRFTWPAPGYYERVAAGVGRARSEKFREEFFATGGLTLAQAKAQPQLPNWNKYR